MGKSKGKSAIIKPRKLSTRSNSDSSGGSGIGGGSTAFNGIASRCDGNISVGRRYGRDDNKDEYENEILLSLEESLDWHNQSSGLVSSYNVPLVNNVDSTPLASKSLVACVATDAVEKYEHTKRRSSTPTQMIPQDQLNYLFNSNSPISNYNGIHQPKLLLRRELSDNNLRDIFRPPSRSPSTSPKARARSNSDHFFPSLGLVINTAKSDNIYANDGLGDGKRRPSIPVRPPPPLPPVNQYTYKNNADELLDGFDQSKVAQSKTSRTSPLRGIHIPTTLASVEFDSDRKRAINTKIKRKSKPKIKKNNLVIQPAAPVTVSGGKGSARASHLPQQKQMQQQRVCKPHSPPTTMSPSPSTTSSRPLLPPTHPLSQVQSYLSHDSTSPLRTNRHARSNSAASFMSDYSSAAESEATPQVRGGRRGGGQVVCNILSSGANFDGGFEANKFGGAPGQGQYNKPNMTFSFSDDEEDEDINNISYAAGTVATKLKDRLANTELRGIDISFALHDEATATDPDAQLFRIVPSLSVVSRVPTDVVTTTFVDSKASDDHNNINSQLPEEKSYINHPQMQYNEGDQNETLSLDGSASQVSQFSSDDRFFEGIHNSGLQSLSFEQVADNDFNTCMDVEIEMVYNSGSMSFDTADNNSVVSEDDKVENVRAYDGAKERKEMEKRILQWRRGRHAWMKNSEEHLGNSNGGRIFPKRHWQQLSVINTEKNDGNYDDIEMAPLVLANDHANGNGDSKSPSKNIQQLQSPSAKTPKCRNVFSSSTPQAAHGFDDDDDDDNDDDDDEFTGLTSPLSRNHYSKQSDARAPCSYYFCCCISFFYHELCCCMNSRSSTNWQTSGWKKLLFVSSCFFSLAWLFTGGKLEKHNEPYSNLNKNEDPLARDYLLDDFYALNEYNPMDDAVDSQDQPQHVRVVGTTAFATSNDQIQPSNANDDPLTSENIDNNSRIIDEDDYFAPSEQRLNKDSVINHDNSQQHQNTNIQKMNSLTDVDTVVVLGGCDRRPSSGVAWLVDMLKRLYPELIILNGFPIDDTKTTQRMLPFIADHPPLRSTNRSASAVIPTSDSVVDDEDIDIEHDHIFSNNETSATIIVAAVFLSPYSWVEFMRVGSQEDHRKDGALEWREFVEVELSSMNGTIMDLRAECVKSAMLNSAEREGVGFVLPVRYEDMVKPYSGARNYNTSTSVPLPGIVGLVEQIQTQIGLRPDKSPEWMNFSLDSNDFLADPVVCMNISCFANMRNSSDAASYIRFINEHIDWSVEKLIGYQKWSVPKPDVDQIVVLGERHSGAEWLVERLARCFPNIPVRYGFSRPGKWFQSIPEAPLPQTLIISVFLNPHDWVELMRQNPINAPAHKEMEWSEFVLSSWERERSDLDKALDDTINVNCSFGFYFEEVIPCMTQRDPQSDAFPLYELHPVTSGSRAGDPYASILELRADKIRNFLGAASFKGVVDSILVHYEDLVWDEDYIHLSKPYPGISGLLEEIDDRTNLVPDVDAGWVSDDEDYFKAKSLGVGATKLDPYYVQWMDEHVDWEVETLVGYSP